MNALRWLFLAVLAGCSGIGVWTPNHARAQATNDGALLRIQGLDDLLVAGPITHKNLAVFVLYKDQRARKETDYLTLEEGIEDGLVEVSEDQQEQVQQLRITNRSSKPLFLAAGELVKGGKQDRTLQFSMVVPAKTKNAPLPSFCVEQSRWTGGKQFAPGKNIAANSSQQAIVLFGQQGVWHSVKNYKQQLRTNAARASGKAVQMSTTSSLNEELADNRDVRDLLSSYETALSGIGANLPRPLGLAYAVDGKLTALHVFHSSLLFTKLRPKLIRSAAIDAAAGAVDERPPEVSLQDLGDFIAAAWDGEKSTHKLGLKNIVTRYVAKTTFTCELRHDRQLIHVQAGRIDRRMQDALRGLRQQVPQLNSFPRQQRMMPDNALPQQTILPQSSIQILEPQQTDGNPGDAQQDQPQIRSSRPRRSSRQ